MAIVDEGAYTRGSAVGQAVVGTYNKRLQVDGKWGRYSQKAYESLTSVQRNAVDVAVASVTNGGTVSDLYGYRTNVKRNAERYAMTSAANQDVRAKIIAVAAKEGVSADTALRIAYLESRFKPSAVSPTGATGVFQMTGVAIQDVNKFYGAQNGFLFKKSDMLDVDKGILAGIQYIKIVAIYMVIPTSDAVKIYMGFNIGVGAAAQVLNGQPQLAAKQISLQAYGKPEVYAANLRNAVTSVAV